MGMLSPSYKCPESDFAFSINLNVRHANGMTPLDLAENCQNELQVLVVILKGNFGCKCKIFGFP